MAQPSTARFQRAACAHGLFRVRTWYWASDHLLLAERHGFAMQYRRFFFSDIQSVFVWETRGRWIRVAVQIAVFALLIWLGAAFSAPRAQLIFFLGLVAVLVAEARLGPCAGAELHTINQRERGPLSNRLRSSRRLLAALRTRCEQAQGGSLAAPEDAEAGAAPPPPVELRAAARPGWAPPADGAPRRRYARRRYSFGLGFLIAMLLAQGFWDLLRLGHVLPREAYASLLIGLLLLMAMVFALIDVSLYQVHRALRMFAWSVMGLIFSAYFLAVFTLSLLAMARAAHDSSVFVRQIRPGQTQTGLLLAAVLLLALGMVGLFLSHDGHFLEPPPEALAAMTAQQATGAEAGASAELT